MKMLSWMVRVGLAVLPLAVVTFDAAPAAAAYGCSAAQNQSHTDFQGWSWTKHWSCNNTGGARMYADANRNTHVAWMDSTYSWFVCWRSGAAHEGGNNIWYYSQGDRSVAGYQGRAAWGFMPAVDISTSVDPHPEFPQCPGSTPPPPPPSSGPSPAKNTPLAFLATNNYWATAEMGYGGSDYAMMRSRSNIHGVWQSFTLVDTGDAIAIRSNYNGRYLSVETGYSGADNGMLRARATAIGSLEKFAFVSLGAGKWAIRSKANNLYVAAELGYGGNDYGMLRARSTSIGGWEQFTFQTFVTRTDDARKPLYFVHGYDGDPFHSVPGYDCNEYWGPAANDFRNTEVPGKTTGAIHFVGYYANDVNCGTVIGTGTRSTGIQELGRQLAWRIYNDYSRQGASVDVVGHSMGGLILRAALTGTQQRLGGWPPYIFVEDAVTIATPHGGTAEWAYVCNYFSSDRQCDDMQYVLFPSDFLVWLDDNPQSDVGTDWTLIGADDDEHVPRWRALRMDYAGHLVAYTKPQPTPVGLEHEIVHQITSGTFTLRYRDYWQTSLPYNSDEGWPTLFGAYDPIGIARRGVYYSSAW